MKKITATLLALVTTATALLTGCVTRDTGAFVPVNTTVNDLENHEPIVLMTAEVQVSVTCSGIQVRTLEDGRLEVNANIRNREGRRIQVQINCEFKDEQGFVTEGESPFQNLILTENAQQTVHFVSFNNKAKHFTIRVREAH